MLCNSSIRVSFYAQRVQLALLRESMRSNSSKMLLSAIAYINGRGIIPWGSFKNYMDKFLSYFGHLPIVDFRGHLVHYLSFVAGARVLCWAFDDYNLPVTKSDIGYCCCPAANKSLSILNPKSLNCWPSKLMAPLYSSVSSFRLIKCGLLNTLASDHQWPGSESSKNTLIYDFSELYRPAPAKLALA